MFGCGYGGGDFSKKFDGGKSGGKGRERGSAKKAAKGESCMKKQAEA